MKCVICKDDRPTAGTLFEFSGSVEDHGVICKRCVRELRSRRPFSGGCGFPADDTPCTAEATCGTGTLEEHRQPDSAMPVGSTRTPDTLVLCKEHLNEFLDGTTAPWVGGDL